MRNQARRLGVLRAGAVLAAFCAAARPASGQPMPAGPGGMPDLRLISGKPLPSADLPVGTVTVRVARGGPSNPVVGAEVGAVLQEPRGESRKRTAKTDDSGRATFEGVATGTRFRAEVTVDGERLETEAFAVPAQGGTRTMLIAGLASARGAAPGAPAGAGAAGAGVQQGDFALGVATGTGVPDPSVPAHAIHVHLTGSDGRPISGREVALGQVTDGGLKIHKATSDERGVARFAQMTAGERVGYAAVIEHDGMRVGTDPFRVPEGQGVRADIRTAGKASDPGVLRLTDGSRVALHLRESAFEVVEVLLLENRSDKIFDPGRVGIAIPLPAGFVNAQGVQGDSTIEERKGEGVVVHAAVPPGGIEVRFAFFLPFVGRKASFEQKMPFPLDGAQVVIEKLAGLGIEGAGIRSVEERDAQGRKVLVAAASAVPAGGVLSFSVVGLPGPDQGGRNVAGLLALLLAGAAAVGVRRPPRERDKVEAGRARLAERREKLFAELVALEQGRRAGTGPKNGQYDERRRDIVARLETVYRELASADEQRSPP